MPIGVPDFKNRKSLSCKHLCIARLAGKLTEMDSYLSEWQSLAR